MPVAELVNSLRSNLSKNALTFVAEGVLSEQLNVVEVIANLIPLLL